MSFIVANDKKIRLFKLRKDFLDYVRGDTAKSASDNMQLDNETSTFVDRFG